MNMYHFASLYDVTDHHDTIERLLNTDNSKVLSIKPILKSLDTGEEVKTYISLRHDTAEEDELEGAVSESMQQAYLNAIVHMYGPHIREEMENSKPLRNLMEDLWVAHSEIDTLIDYYLTHVEQELIDEMALGSILVTLETEMNTIGYGYISFYVVNGRTLMLMFHRNESLVIRGANTMYLSSKESPESYIQTFLYLLHPATEISPTLAPVLTYSMGDYANLPIAKYIKTMYVLLTADNRDMVMLYRALKPLDFFSKDDIIVPDLEAAAGIYFNDDTICDLLEDIGDDADITYIDEDFIIEIEFAAQKFKQMGESFELIPQLFVHAGNDEVRFDLTNHIAYFMGIRDFKPSPELSIPAQVSEFMYNLLLSNFGRLTQLSYMDYLPVDEEEELIAETPFGKIELSCRLPIWFYLILIPLFIYSIDKDLTGDSQQYGFDGELSGVLESIVARLKELLHSERMLS